MKSKRLQSIRHKLGLSTDQLASLLGCSPRTIEDYEQGRRGIPDAVALRLTGVCPCCKKSAPEYLIQVPNAER